VTLADPQSPPDFTYRESVPFQYDAYVMAAGGHLPFADAVFPLVTSHDTLEHVPPESRPAFLHDIIRVSSGFVILNGPVYQPEAAEAEQRLARFLEHNELGRNVSLDDHLALGLPPTGDIEEVIRETGLPFVGLPNGNLAIWLFMMGVKHYLISLPHSDELHQEVDRTYNTLLAPTPFGGVCYRRAYVIATRREDAAVLSEIESLFAGDIASAGLPLDMLAVGKLVDLLEGHSGRVRSDLNALRARATQLDARLRDREHLIAENNRQIAELESSLSETETHVRALAHEYQLTTNAVGFRMLQRFRRVLDWFLPPNSRRRSAFRIWRRAFEIALSDGWGTLLKRSLAFWKWGPRVLHGARMGAPQAMSIDDQYQLWLAAHALSPADIRRIREEAAAFTYRPTISIVVPTYNTNPDQLREAIESVRGQFYDAWELCIADDASTRPEVRGVLREYEDGDRIKVAYLKGNGGISAASNAALALATGEFLGLLDHDDELKPEALYHVVKLLNQQPDLDFIYSDEDKRDADGRLVQPFFKPDWSPDLLLCENYVPHFAVYRRRLLEDAGGFRSQCDFSQDYDLALRVTERTDRIAHIPLPLYTWRMIPGSAALESSAKPMAVEAAKRALSDAIQRRGLDAEVLEGPHPNTYRVRYRIQGQPLVTIIIPTRDRVGLLRACINSIEQKTTYPNYEIVIVDNDSADPATLDYLKASPHRVIPYPGPFRYAAMMNFAVRETAGEHIVLLNNDTAVITPDWIEAMLEHSQRPEVAAVGARLLYPDDTPQHEGVIIGLGGGSALNADHKGYFGLGDLVLNCTAVTGACMMVRRDAWDRWGGFEETLGVAFNDVDYCLRAHRDGYRIIYTPFAVLYHHESATRGTLHPEEDEQYFRQRWGKPGEYRDPYYNPNLSIPRPFNLDV
jgi:GT2 family glycosyltransferase